MIVLGVSAYYHDSAACLVRDGEVLWAAQEERFTRKKHDPRFPVSSLERGLLETGLTLGDISHVAYYDKPLLTFDRLLETWLAFAPGGLSSFMAALPAWLDEKLFISREIDKSLGGVFKGPIHYLRHHESHAASAFFPSPFEEAAILTMDGVGEWSTTTLGAGTGNKISLLKDIRFPHSLGLLYSAFTYYLGFTVNSGEYKVMGLAPYGTPRYAGLIRRHLIDVKSDGSFWMDMRYFDYGGGLRMTNRAFHDLFGGEPRVPSAPLTRRHMDLAASVQAVCEEVMLLLAREAKRVTGADDLCLAGGCALNCVGNGLLAREKVFKRMFIQPAAGDAGGSLGAALMTWYQILGNKRSPETGSSLKGSFLGTSYSQEEVRRALDSCRAAYTVVHGDGLPIRTAELVLEGKVVGLFNGRMEFGPRALGHRSILGDARRLSMQSKMNLAVKFRESFRPFAPAVLEEEAGEWFDLEQDSPYMMLTAPVSPRRRKPVDARGKEGLDLLSLDRSDIPAVTHVDGSARVQTLTEERNGFFYRVVKAFSS